MLQYQLLLIVHLSLSFDFIYVRDLLFCCQDKIALDPFPDIDKEEARRNAPFRFLGLKLTNCSFEDITYRDIGVINQLAGLGFDETIIRETALKTERCANELITKDILDLITYYFARKQLAKDWFNAFFQSLDLKHVKESTKKGRFRFIVVHGLQCLRNKILGCRFNVSRESHLIPRRM